MYLLFGMYRYYPSGGWNDFKGSFATLEAAEEAGKSGDWDFWHVVANCREVSYGSTGRR